jgi:hypothetical protein
MSLPISLLNPALTSIHNENNNSIATLNFDFTLFKLEAPREFNTEGATISESRKAMLRTVLYIRQLGSWMLFSKTWCLVSPRCIKLRGPEFQRSLRILRSILKKGGEFSRETLALIPQVSWPQSLPALVLLLYIYSDVCWRGSSRVRSLLPFGWSW